MAASTVQREAIRCGMEMSVSLPWTVFIFCAAVSKFRGVLMFSKKYSCPIKNTCAHILETLCENEIIRCRIAVVSAHTNKKTLKAFRLYLSNMNDRLDSYARLDFLLASNKDLPVQVSLQNTRVSKSIR